jgi:uncharacterized protein YigE (DUF2233 family)
MTARTFPSATMLLAAAGTAWMTALTTMPSARADPPHALDRTHCRVVDFEDRAIAACVIDPRTHHFVLDFGDGTGGLGSLQRFVASLPPGRVTAAMNAGMWRVVPDVAPVGLHVENGVQRSPLETDDGSGNFYLKPNGVFFVAVDGRAGILETGAFEAASPAVLIATQSGPLMVSGGEIHPRIILPTSEFEKIRNGIGITDDGRVVFALSLEEVSFGLFARMFRDELGTPDALFLDGEVSRLYAPALRLTGSGWWPIGPMIAAVER